MDQTELEQTLALLRAVHAAARNGRISARDQLRIGMTMPPTLRNLLTRSIIHNPDGSYSTTSSASAGTDNGEMLFPTAYDGAHHGLPESVARAQQTGQHLGVFTDATSANRFATALHDYQAQHGMKPQPFKQVAQGMRRS